VLTLILCTFIMDTVTNNILGVTIWKIEKREK